VTSFFNPAGYKTKLHNYRVFRSSSKKQGLKLLAVELAFGEKPFELDEQDADILIQRRSDSVMWQKERLLNLGADCLPEDCDKVAWLDCDIIFNNSAWIQETSDLLELFVVVKPFTTGVRLLKDTVYNPEKDTIESKGWTNNEIFYAISRMSSPQEFGLGWAIRRSVLQKHGLYDKMIIGSGDTVIHDALRRGRSTFSPEQIPVSLLRDQNKWAKAFYADTHGSVSSAGGLAYHLWHGDFKQRYHIDRHILKDYDFDLRKDIKLDQGGCWAWSSKKKDLHRAVKDFFHVRNEDSDQMPDFKDRKIRRLEQKIRALKKELADAKQAHKPK